MFEFDKLGLIIFLIWIKCELWKILLFFIVSIATPTE